jgi:hypothetical protein
MEALPRPGYEFEDSHAVIRARSRVSATHRRARPSLTPFSRPCPRIRHDFDATLYVRSL